MTLHVTSSDQALLHSCTIIATGEAVDKTRFQETNPLQQAEDYHDAVSFVQTLSPAIDGNQIAIWGICHSGGASTIAAGDDPRINAATFNMPLTSGREDAKSFPPGLLEGALTDREVHLTIANNRRAYIPVWDDTIEQAPSAGGLIPDGRPAWLHGQGIYEFITGGVARSKAAGKP